MNEINLINKFNSKNEKKYWNYQNIMGMYCGGYFNKLNEELFLLALKLNEAYIIKNGKEISENLKLFMPEGQSSYICQKFYDSSDIYNADKQEIIRNLWNTLFLCFPVVTTTLDSLCKRCFHLIPEYIDLELIDEAGQILPHNVVTALYRAKKAVIVGDIKQIEPIYNNVNKNFNEYQNAIGEKFENIKIEENSIQALASKNTDILSDGENIILNEHYRCERNIINFSNQNVYENKLNMNVEDKFDKPFFNNMIALDVRGKRTRKDNQNGSKNENKVEAEACIQAIKYIKEQDKSNPSIAIVTPFREQKRLLESRLEREGLTDIKIGTVHAFQGKEKDYVLFTPTLDAIEPKWAIKFIGDKYNMLNVAVTRAKKQFIYVGNVDVAERSENYIAKLIKYIKANGLVYSLYDIENSVLNKNFSERILQVLQPELEIANDNIGLYIQNNFKCGTIIDAKQHYDLLMYILKNTKKELLIMSPWLRKNVINVQKQKNTIIFKGICDGEIKEIVEDYFDLKRNYEEIKNKLSQIDENVKTSIEYGQGIRILNQDLWEMIISYIISANNNIPRIKGIIERLSKTYGQEIEWNGEKYYTFPTPEELKDVTVEDYRKLGTGFRDIRLYETVHMILDKKVNLEEMQNNSNTLEVREQLLTLSGVGPKVADCILLFSTLKRFEVFPIDVWVRRVMNELYIKNEDETKVNKKEIEKLAHAKFGNLAGIAQQYLFYWKREA